MRLEDLEREAILLTRQIAIEQRRLSAGTRMDVADKFRDQVLRPLLEAGLLQMTIPDKLKSSKQQCATTDAGRAARATTSKKQR